MDSIIAKLRNLIQDNLKYHSYSFVFYTSRIFNLPDSNVEEPIVIERNGVEWDSGNYEYNPLTNKVTIHEVTGEDELVPGESLEFSYSCYEKYSSSELSSYIKNALYHLAVEKYKTFTASNGIIFPTPTEAEENLIVIIASILIKGSIRSYRTPEFTITFGENMSTEDKIKKLINNFDKSSGTITYIDLSESPAEEED